MRSLECGHTAPMFHPVRLKYHQTRVKLSQPSNNRALELDTPGIVYKFDQSLRTKSRGSLPT